MHATFRVCTVVLLVAVGGCGKKAEEGPTTYAVTGKVVFPDGKPLARGHIEFNSPTDSTVRATGVIDENGVFSLQTSLSRSHKPGAVAGLYKVTVTGFEIPRDGAAPPRYEIEQLYTVAANDSNHFTIKLPQQ